MFVETCRGTSLLHKHQKFKQQKIPRRSQPHREDFAPLLSKLRVFHEDKEKDIGDKEIKHLHSQMAFEMLQEIIRFLEDDVFVESECRDVTEDESNHRCADVPHTPTEKQ